MADGDSKWLRKATELERMFEIGHQLQVYLTQYTLDLASVKPIEEEFLRRALTHLYRKVPVLRVCLRLRNSELWLREMDGCIIDLKVIEDGNLEEESDKETLHKYNSESGPLWCVRLLRMKGSSVDFPYHYSLILGIHHSLSDGTTNVKICDLLCRILNSLMGGLPIDDAEQLGELVGNEVLPLYEQEMAKLKENPQLGREIQKELEEGSKVRPLIRHICEIPSDAPVTSKKISVVVDPDLTSKFHRRAKAEGVSLHAALTSLINLSLVKLLQEHGIVQDEYNIRAGHDIDIRRYYSGDASRVIGVQGPMFGYRSPFLVPKDLFPVFWNVAKEFHDKLHKDINSRKVLTTSAYKIMTEDTNHNFEEMFRADGEPDYYYTISNMGNIAALLSEGGQYLSVQKLTRFCSLRSRGSFMVIFIHTFRNKLNFTFAYSTRFLNHDFVHRLQELFQSYMASVCET
ncbi:uncharacterized protein LOC135219723 [Macrobrachium nipponense]|uniref:uncharacterized protein LOC135219723 n=1 Tax=Macrobrachium nipponense TaxID=159736 RepID=UPI0030C88E92